MVNEKRTNRMGAAGASGDAETVFRCTECERVYPIADRLWRCECGAPFDLELGSGLHPEEIETERASLWRYRRAFLDGTLEPVADFGEPITPLVERRWEGEELLFKLDFLFPSGSYKDRGFAVLASHLRTIGVERVHVDSSGNAGASLAAYAAASGLDCSVRVPAYTPSGKTVQISSYGARVIRVPGSRQAAADAAMKEDEGFYATHNWSPIFLEGVKSLAYELWEQLDFRAPGAVFAPIGYGSLVLSLDRGFRELRRAGSIDTLPRLFGCQALECAPLYRAFRTGDPAAARLDGEEVGETVAEGVASSRPVRPRQVLEAVGRSEGEVLALTEEQIVRSLGKLHRRGLYVEPTSAVAAAGATRILRAGKAPWSGPTVMVLTGSGLKTTEKLSRLQDDERVRSS